MTRSYQLYNSGQLFRASSKVGCSERTGTINDQIILGRLQMFRLLTVGFISVLFQASPVETRIVQYLKANVTPGKPVVVSELYNNVFKTPEEQKVLERLYNTFFKIPMFIVQYNAGSKRIPTLKEISEQFNFRVPGEA